MGAKSKGRKMETVAVASSSPEAADSTSMSSMLATLEDLSLFSSSAPSQAKKPPTLVSTSPLIYRSNVGWPEAEKPHYMYGPPGTRDFVVIDTLPRLIATSKLPAWTAKRSAPPKNLPYRLEQVPGKGIGMIATRDLSLGDRIVTELPILLTSHHFAETAERVVETVDQLYEQAVDGVSPDSRARYLALHNSMFEEFPFAGIRCQNGFGVFDYYNPPADAGPTAVFDLICKANHSCSPNAAFTFDTLTLEGMLSAAGPIKAGEEICTYYYDPWAPREERQACLEETYDFTCACSCCELPASKVEESDVRRTRIRDLITSDEEPPTSIGAIEEVLGFARDEGLAIYKAQLLEEGLRLHLRNLKLRRSDQKATLLQAEVWSKRAQKAYRAEGKLLSPTYAEVLKTWHLELGV